MTTLPSLAPLALASCSAFALASCNAISRAPDNAEFLSLRSKNVPSTLTHPILDMSVMICPPISPKLSPVRVTVMLCRDLYPSNFLPLGSLRSYSGETFTLVVLRLLSAILSPESKSLTLTTFSLLCACAFSVVSASSETERLMTSISGFTIVFPSPITEILFAIPYGDCEVLDLNIKNPTKKSPIARINAHPRINTQLLICFCMFVFLK